MSDSHTTDEILEWASSNIILRNSSFSLERYPFLAQIYQDISPIQVFRKAAQVGITTYHIIKSLWLADTRTVKIIYFFPTDSDVRDFSKDRVAPIISASPLLRERVRGTDNVGLKKLGDSSLYFRGLLGKVRVRSVDADYIIFDELDMADRSQKEYARDRILHSSLAWESELSTPSLPGVGIDASFKASDQHFWLVKCPSCSTEEPLEEHFPDCIGEVGGEVSIVCPRCHTPLDVRCGRWVAKHPQQGEVRGYQLSQLIAGIISPGRLLSEFKGAKNETVKRRFYNSMLGLPYAGGMVPLDGIHLQACLGSEPMRLEVGPSYMGVDVGDTLHISVGKMTTEGRVRIFWLEATESWERLDELIEACGVLCTVIDAMPYKHSAKEFALSHPGRVYIAYYQGEHLAKGREGKGEKAVPKVNIDRSESLDELVARLSRGEISLPQGGGAVEEALRHLGRLRKERREGAGGRTVMGYAHGLEDHYAMALNYMLVATAIAPIKAEREGISLKGLRTFK